MIWSPKIFFGRKWRLGDRIFPALPPDDFSSMWVCPRLQIKTRAKKAPLYRTPPPPRYCRIYLPVLYIRNMCVSFFAHLYFCYQTNCTNCNSILLDQWLRFPQCATHSVSRQILLKEDESFHLDLSPLSFFPRKKMCPQVLTSGVSAGQIMPQSVLCSCRGLANFPSRPIGELRRRR